jgi:phage terminase small subunit
LNNKDYINNELLDEVLDSGLTENEQNFIINYMDSHNVIQSYMKSYNTSRIGALKNSYALFHKDKIQNEIKRLKKIMMVGLNLDLTRYVEKLDNVANSDIGNYITFKEEEIPMYEDDGTPMVNPDTGEPITKKINKMHLVDSDTVDTSLIQEIKQGKDGISIKLMDKQKAWESLKDFFGWEHKEENKGNKSNSFIDALKNSSKVWDEGDVDKDLKEMEEKDV